MPMMKLWRKRVRKNPRPFTVHVDERREPLASCATRQEAFEAVEADVEQSKTVRHYTIVDGPNMRVAWNGVR